MDPRLFRLRQNEKKHPRKKYPIAIVNDEPKKIKIADKPLKQGGEVSLISHKDFKKKFNCKYTEGLYAEKKRPHSVKTYTFPYLKHLVVCPSNNKEVGFVLCTDIDIYQKEEIMQYGGEQFTYGRGNDFYSLQRMDGNYVSPRDLGGLARFMPHFPEISEYQFNDNPSIENAMGRAATPNVMVDEDENGILIVTAITDIPKGSILGWYYGGRYWASRLPRLFTHQGTLIPIHEIVLKGVNVLTKLASNKQQSAVFQDFIQDIRPHRL